MSIRLSICIPTYKRAAYLGETLQSIIDQATHEVDIVVSDNASNDDTQAIVDRFRTQFKRITYFCFNQNMGADRNFLKAVELATGDYCWLMGSDDRIEPGGIARILAALRENPGISGISSNVQAYDSGLKERIYAPAPTKLESDCLFASSDACFSTLGAWFGYLSGQIVCRQRWNEIVTTVDVSPYCHAYVHVYVIARMLCQWPKWLYSSHKSVGWRSGNDSFLAEGIYKRLMIDVIGYEKIAGDVFGRESNTYDSMMQTVATVHVRAALMSAKLNNAPSTFFLKALQLCSGFYWRYPKFWIKTFPVLLLPRFMFLAIRIIYRATLRPLKVHRASLKQH